MVMLTYSVGCHVVCQQFEKEVRRRRRGGGERNKMLIAKVWFLEGVGVPKVSPRCSACPINVKINWRVKRQSRCSPS
jgi:hypothetical protein